MVDRVQQAIELLTTFTEAERAELREKLEHSYLQQQPETSPKSHPDNKRHVKQSGLKCPGCGSSATKGHGKYRDRRRYKCLSCGKTFNDLTNTPLSGIHLTGKMNAVTASMANGGVSLRNTAKEMGICLKTAFDWRHKVLQGYGMAPSRKLKGIAEADETFFLFSEKGDKSVSERRTARKRGGKASTAGISDEHVAVIVGCDRGKELVIGVAGRGRISVKDIEEILGKRIDPKAILCTDSHKSFKAFAKAYDLKYEPINITKGHRVVKKIYHVQNVNGAHKRLKEWMIRFHGVATKYLNTYTRWFSLMEETKSCEDQVVEFVERSINQRKGSRV